MCTCWKTDIYEEEDDGTNTQDWFACNDHFVQYSHVDGLVRMHSYDANFAPYPCSYVIRDCCAIRNEAFQLDVLDRSCADQTCSCRSSFPLAVTSVLSKRRFDPAKIAHSRKHKHHHN
jgi:hypothetical protein